MLFFKKRNSFLDARVPWMTYKVIGWLNHSLKKDWKVFEWGSGGSSLFFEEKVAFLFSVEHNPKWYRQIKRMLSKKVVYKLIKPESDGRGYRSTDVSFQGCSFRHYCRSILTFPDNFFDLISIDGRARNDCLKLARKKVKIGGYILLDNSERKEYRRGINFLKGFVRRDFRGNGPVNEYPWQTTVFQRKT